jgi:hypothetical protein
MTARAKNPATATADQDQQEVRTAEQPAEQPAEEAPERDSHEDLVRRVERLEFRVF